MLFPVDPMLVTTSNCYVPSCTN